MTADIVGNKFSIDCDSLKINKIMFIKIGQFMEQNEYFHEDHFLEFLEEDDRFEIVDIVSEPDAIITIAQLEDWVEEAAADSDDEDLDEDLDVYDEDEDEDNFYDDDDDEDGDDDE